MPTLGDVFLVLGELTRTGVITDYAVGGATAVLFYAEPTRTYDLDVFVGLVDDTPALAPLTALYSWARGRGFETMAEHVMIHGVGVQFRPAHNPLAREAIAAARTLDYEGVAVRVIDPDHLAAMALQAGGARRRGRAWQLLEAGAVDRHRLQHPLEAHGINAVLPDDV